jgi:transposase
MYKEKLSGFREAENDEEWTEMFERQAFVFAENWGKRMSLDETQMPDGEFWTILTNKDRKGRDGSLVAMIRGTKTEVVVEEIQRKIPLQKCLDVEEITVDFANNMALIARQVAPHARITGDRFHAQKLVNEAVQKIRINYRWEALEREKDGILATKKSGEKYETYRFENGETEKELLARSRHLLSKPKSKWTGAQHNRARILFEYFPEIKRAYGLSMYFRNMFEQSKSVQEAQERLDQWSDHIERFSENELREFQVVNETVKRHKDKILNYFYNRQTNASAEAFNAKIKQFVARSRGVADLNFFLFRLAKYFAFKKFLNPFFY